MQSFVSPSIRLWQLISPTLPIGSFCYSQAMEYAVEAGWVNDETSASQWILGQIKNNLALLDVPVFLRMYDAWQHHQPVKIDYWNDVILASREAAELRTEDVTMGQSMRRMLAGLDVNLPDTGSSEIAFVTAFSFACQHWCIDRLEAAHGLLWSWCENQVAAAIKLVPLGQTSGQRILSQSITSIAQAVDTGRQCDDENIGLSAPGLAIASALHETQYSRLFRS